MRFLTFICLFSIVLFGCRKEEGFGGLASVSGRVYAYDYDKSGVLQAEGYAGDIEVYIGAAGKKEILDRIRTSYDGSFELTSLRKGSYEVWIYSSCDACPNGIEPVIKEFKISSKKEQVDLGIFEINI